MKIRETTANVTKTFELTLTKEEATWLHALLDFPLHEAQPDEAVAVWSNLATVLDEAWDWDLPGAAGYLEDVTSL